MLTTEKIQILQDRLSHAEMRGPGCHPCISAPELREILEHIEAASELRDALAPFVAMFGTMLGTAMGAVTRHDLKAEDLAPFVRAAYAALTKVSGATPPPGAQPWYPDNGGGWVESYGLTPKLLGDTPVQTLGVNERRDQVFRSRQKQPVRDWYWSGVVAYRAVKP